MIATKHSLKENKYSVDDLEVRLNTPVLAKSEKEFLPCDDRWNIDLYSNNSIDVESSTQAFLPEIRPYMRLALAKYAQSHAFDSVYNVANCLTYFQTLLDRPINILDESDFMVLKGRVGSEREYRLSVVRGFLKYWYHDTSLFGVDSSFYKAIYSLRLQGNEKGEAVKSNDPLKGPYTPIELQSIVDGVNNSFLEGELDLEQYVMMMLFVQRGLRRIQLIQLCFSDFYVEGGVPKIRQPKGKDRGSEGTGFRERFTPFRISEDLYNAIQLLKVNVGERINQETKAGYAETLPDYPLFLDFNNKKELKSLSKRITSENVVSRDSVSARLMQVARVISVVSERTGEVMHLTSKRFRSTMGSDLAREGAGVGVIAAALDHSDYQNAGVYVKTSPEMATRLDEKLGKYLAPLAQAFAGHIVRDESEAIRGNDSSSRIRTMDGEDAVGTCGKMTFCNVNAPVGCYTCIKFQPWLDAPHEDVLIDLYEERREILEVLGDETMAGVLDRSILAVEDVVRRCSDIKSKEMLDG